jgi:hypothetical protein
MTSSSAGPRALDAACAALASATLVVPDADAGGGGAAAAAAHLWSVDACEWSARGAAEVSSAAFASAPPSLAPPPPRRTRRGGGRAAQTRWPCSVPGCGAVLAAPRASAYCLRYRVCEACLTAPSVRVPGDDAAAEGRWCQKCSTWHALSAFEGAKRTCAAAAARSAVRRRAAKLAAAAAEATAAAAAAAAAPPPPPPAFSALPPLTRELVSLGGVWESEDVWLLGHFGNSNANGNGNGSGSGHGSSYGHSTAPLSDDAWSARFPSPALAAVKLHDAAPAALPPVLRDALRSWADSDDIVADGAVADAHGGRLMSDIITAVRPGCTLLSVAALRGAGGGAGAQQGASHMAAALAEALPPSVGRFSVCDAAGRVVHSGGGGAVAARVAAAPAPPLAPLRAHAVCTARRAWWRRSDAPLVLCARDDDADAMMADASHPQVGPYRVAASFFTEPPVAPPPIRADARSGEVTLDARRCDALGGASGFACFSSLHAAALPWQPADAAQRRAVLLTPDAAAAAEVCAGLAHVSDAEASAVVTLCGAALLAGAPARTTRAAASCAAQRGWNNLLRAYLNDLAASVPPCAEDADDDDDDAREDMPMHGAARGGNAAAVRLLARTPGGGDALSVDDVGATPLHYAARLRRGAARHATLRALLASHPAARRAFDTARDATGRTPAQYAAAADASERSYEAAYLAWAVAETRSSAAVVAALQLTRALHTASRAATLLRAPDAQHAAAMLTRLEWAAVRSMAVYRVESGARVPLDAVPWHLLQSLARVMLRFILAVHAPLNAALLLLSLAPRLRAAHARWHVVAYAAAALTQVLYVPIAEAASLRPAGLVIDYTWLLAAQEGVVLLLLSGALGGTFAGAARMDVNAPLGVVRFLSFAGCLLTAGRTGAAVAAASPHVLTHAALAALGAASVPWNARRLRRLFEQATRARARKAA